MKGHSIAVVCNPHCDEVILDKGASPCALTFLYICVEVGSKELLRGRASTLPINTVPLRTNKVSYNSKQPRHNDL